MSFLGDDDEWSEQDSLLAAARQDSAAHNEHSHGDSGGASSHGHSHDDSSHGDAGEPELFLLNPEESAHGHPHGGEGGGHGHAHGDEGHDHDGHGHSHGGKENKAGWDMKVVAFWSIGILTMLYVVAELGMALYLGSLTLLSDGFHNLSDVISLYIAYWATQAAKRPLSDKMSFGWARTELLGALLNGTFLLALCLYTFLEAIPEIITAAEATSGMLFWCGGCVSVPLVFLSLLCFVLKCSSWCVFFFCVCILLVFLVLSLSLLSLDLSLDLSLLTSLSLCWCFCWYCVVLLSLSLFVLSLPCVFLFSVLLLLLPAVCAFRCTRTDDSHRFFFFCCGFSGAGCVFRCVCCVLRCRPGRSGTLRLRLR
jgi:Cation efflux family